MVVGSNTPVFGDICGPVFAKYPADAVAVYLHSFQGMDIAGWPPLAEMLDQDQRLQLKPVPAAS